MKREIKFRGKDVDTKQWVYGDLQHSRGDENYGIIRNVEGLHDVLLLSVCQFTGMYQRPDGEGKGEGEIYEGDIIRVDGEDQLLVVVYYEYMFGLANAREYGYLKKGAHPFLNDYAHLRALGEIELQGLVRVVGNVFDNPELMQEGGEV